ncbi:MAG: hypothetical protein Ct9H300mP28_35580 [Pseudomonadota bacterium]|nr:MAG: hypothetical protein Ct9H300mP28_35580 [Pseudomonadota bacterium]
MHIYIDQQKKIVDSEQENAPAHYNLARSYYFIKEYEKAEHHARKATDMIHLMRVFMSYLEAWLSFLNAMATPSRS